MLEHYRKPQVAPPVAKPAHAMQQHAHVIAFPQSPQRLLQLASPPHEHLVRGNRDLLVFLDKELLVAMGRRHHGAPRLPTNDGTAAARPKPQTRQVPVVPPAFLRSIEQIAPRRRYRVRNIIAALKLVIEPRRK